MLGVILMSGRGERFSNAGYEDPKPLIKVDEKMMFEYSIDHFAHPKKYLFIVNKTINNNSKFQDFIKNFDKDYKIITHNEVTNGQATSLYLAVKDFNSEEGFFVSSCDLSFVKITELDLNKNIIFTTKPEKYNFENADQYGWVENINDNYKVTCKKMPNTTNDISVLTGCFYFKSLLDFKTAYQNMVNTNSKINNEYYLDNIFNFDPLRSDTSVTQVENYKSFGTPQEIL